MLHQSHQFEESKIVTPELEWKTYADTGREELAVVSEQHASSYQQAVSDVRELDNKV